MKQLELLVPPPVVMLVLVGLMWIIHRFAPVLHWHPGPESVLARLLLILALAVLGAASYQFWRHGTTIDPRNVDRSTSLITGGIFALSRNPIYLADAILLLAFAVWLGAGINLLLVALFVFYIHRFQIVPEERGLHDVFGGAYREYGKKVRRWI